MEIKTHVNSIFNIKEETLKALENKTISSFLSQFINQDRKRQLLEESKEMDSWIDIKPNLSQRLFHIVYGFERPICSCGNFRPYLKFGKGYKKTCGLAECQAKATKEGTIKTNLEKYGVECTFTNKDSREKAKSTLMERYGVDSTMKGVLKEKVDKTILVRYGVENILQNSEILHKVLKTRTEKYGSLDIYNLPASKKNRLEKYGNENVSHTSTQKFKDTISIFMASRTDKEFIERLKNSKYNTFEFLKIDRVNNTESSIYFKCLTCAKVDIMKRGIFSSRIKFYKNHNPCLVCNPPYCSSKPQKDAEDFIRENYKGQILINHRKFFGKLECDIFLPDLNLGFEFNGVYWHSDNSRCKLSDGDFKYRHLRKSEHFATKGVNCVYIWEDDWFMRQNLVKSNILNLLNVYEEIYKVEDLEFKMIGVNDAQEFIEDNYLRDFIPSSKYFGLVYENEILMVVSFKNNLINHIVTKINCKVDNGLEFLLNKVKNYLKTTKFKNIEILKNLEEDFLNDELKILGFEKSKKLIEPIFEFICNKHQRHKTRINKRTYKIYNSGFVKYKKCL